MLERFIIMDIGATHTRVAVGDRDGKILYKVKFKTIQNVSGVELVEHIIRFIRRNFKKMLDSVKAISVGAIGPLNIKKGEIVRAPNIGVGRVPLREMLSETFKVPVYVVNDCVAGVYGEWYWRFKKKIENITYITFSTGIGGGVIVDGNLLIGKDGNAHEIGHLVVDYSGRLKCGCGGLGHWEAYTSGSGIPNFVRYLIKQKFKGEVFRSRLLNIIDRLTPKELFELARLGDRLALKIVEEIGIINTAGVASVVNLYDPEIIVIGGSIALNNKDLILNPILSGIKNFIINRRPKIELTEFGDNVVLYGALAIAVEPPETLTRYLNS